MGETNNGSINDTAAKELLKEQVESIVTQVAGIENIENFDINLDLEAKYGDGFVAYFYKGEITNKDTDETTAIAIKKAPDWDWEFSYEGLFKNEILFYSTIFPTLDNLQSDANVYKPFDNVPKYFCGGMEPKNMFLAMKDLRPLGYTMFDKQKYLDQKHLNMIFQIYGKYHALSYVLRIKNLEKYKEISQDLTNVIKPMKHLMENIMGPAVAAAIRGFDPESDKIICDELKDLPDKALDMFIESTDYAGEFRCIAHGDCWSNNMLFKYSESGQLLNIKLLDFQLCMDSSPIHDLSYFFYSGASKKDFDILDDYLQIYYKSFYEFAKELGVKAEDIISFEALKDEWKENATFGVLFGIYLWQIKLVPKQNINDIMVPNAGEKPSMEEVMKLWQELIDKVYQSDMYKERTTSILRHAYEYGIINKNKIERSCRNAN